MNAIIQDVIRQLQEINNTMEIVIENNEDVLNKMDAPMLANLSNNTNQLIDELTKFDNLIE